MAGERTKDVWEKRWEAGTTSWHRLKVDARLQKYLKELTKGEAGVSILVPWCGKSLDVPWLCQEGYNVVGVELSEIAGKQMFEENAIPYTVSKQGEFVVYQANDRKLKFFAGNFYKFTPNMAGTFEAIWDCNAFGAAEPEDREAYQRVIVSLLKPKGQVLLANWEYGDQKRNNAPYSLCQETLKELFQEKFEVRFLENPEEFVSQFMKKFDVDWAKHQIHMFYLK